MYKYKKLQTLINYIVTKHGNTPQGASKITVSLLVQEVTQRAGTGGQRPERPSPYKNPAVVIPKAMYKLHSRKRGPGARRTGRRGVPEKRARHLPTQRLGPAAESCGPLPPRGLWPLPAPGFAATPAVAARSARSPGGERGPRPGAGAGAGGPTLLGGRD